MGHICRIGNRYYYRIRIPKDLLKFFPSGELKKSLKTVSFKSAKALVKVYSFQAERLFTLVRSGMLTDTQIKQLQAEYFHNGLKDAEDYRAGKSYSDIEAVTDEIETFELVHSAALDNLVTNNLKVVEHAVNSFLEERGISIDRDAYKKLCRGILRAQAEMLSVEIERLKGNYQNEYDTRFNSLTAAPVNSDYAASTQPDDSKEAGKTLSEAIALHMKEKALGKKLKPRSRVEYDSVYGLFQDAIAYLTGKQDAYLSSLDTDTLIKYSETLSQLPANARKSKALRDKSIGEVLEAVKDAPVKPISDATKNRNLGLVSSLLKWCVRRGYMKLNPAEGLGVKESGKASDKREIYTREDLELLLSAPEFKSPDKDRPERFWIPLIALYSGMRLEEICQLHTKDIREVEGFPCFDVNENAPDKSVKSGAGIRLVPIHPTLIELGFLHYVQNHADAPRLWMTLERKKERYGLDFGKWYGKQVKAKLFTGRDKLNFHSFRHTFIDNLARQGVDLKLIKDIVGHSQEDITQGRYTKVHMDLLFDAIKKLDYSIDLSHLQGKAPL